MSIMVSTAFCLWRIRGCGTEGEDMRLPRSLSLNMGLKSPLVMPPPREPTVGDQSLDEGSGGGIMRLS